MEKDDIIFDLDGKPHTIKNGQILTKGRFADGVLEQLKQSQISLTSASTGRMTDSFGTATQAQGLDPVLEALEQKNHMDRIIYDLHRLVEFFDECIKNRFNSNGHSADNFKTRIGNLDVSTLKDVQDKKRLKTFFKQTEACFLLLQAKAKYATLTEDTASEIINKRIAEVKLMVEDAITFCREELGMNKEALLLLKGSVVDGNPIAVPDFIPEFIASLEKGKSYLEQKIHNNMDSMRTRTPKPDITG